MAVTAVLKRSHVFKGTNGTEELGTATLSGTYATGGFTFNISSLTGGSGSSPYGGTPIDMQFRSPLGYIYVSTFAQVGNVVTMTTKVFSAANTELTAGATPEASVPFILTRRFITN
jgi:hypothetical protein